MRGNFAAIALTVIGAVALGVNLELFELDVVAMLCKGWPLAVRLSRAALSSSFDDSGKKKPGA